MLLSRKISELQARKARGEKGFSLIEMLVVVIIIGVIAAIAVPLFLNQQEKAEESNTKTTLTTLAKALANGQGTGGTASVADGILSVTDGAGGITTAPLNGATVTGTADLSEGDWCVSLDDYGVGAGEASPSTSSACAAANRTYAIGDIGPGGGIVFYDAGSRQPWGRYLEVAPSTWNGGASDPSSVWCNNTSTQLFTSSAIGAGKNNTDVMVAACTSGAANSVRAYTGGGKNDWFLPSQSEGLQLLSQRGVMPEGFSNWGWGYWTSSDWHPTSAYIIRFDGVGTWGQNSKSSGITRVRPIRAF